MRVYIPFEISREEINDVSLLFDDTKILQAVFGSACIIDYKKNEFTSEIAYIGKTVDIVHISTLDYQISQLSDGTLIDVDLNSLQAYMDNDEAYFVWRMPHKSLDKLFKSRVGAGSVMSQFRDLITSPMLSEKHGYSVRVNEPRLLPEEITRVGSFHRQKIKKTVITISISEDYDINDEGCYRIRHLEEELYKDYIPYKYKTDDVISYQWHQNRESKLQGQFNFYYNITKNSVNGASMTVYMILLMLLAVMGEILGDFAKTFLGLQ
jgi:phosphohistidine swiveling domain-containing protein